VSRKEVRIRVMWIAEKMALLPQSTGCETTQVDHAQPFYWKGKNEFIQKTVQNCV
jgi:hypothetical protein